MLPESNELMQISIRFLFEYSNIHICLSKMVDALMEKWSLFIYISICY